MSGRDTGEAERTRANLLQVGKVAEVDYDTARVRVEMAGLTSAWLPWTTGRAGGNRSWAAPEIGEQVMVACPGGDPANGVVLGAIYHQTYAAPADSADVTRTVYADGAVIEYDRAAHILQASLPTGGAAHIVAPGGVTIVGNVEVTGTITATGAITSDTDVIAGTNEISAIGHVHGSVQSGPSNTGVPVP